MTCRPRTGGEAGVSEIHRGAAWGETSCSPRNPEHSPSFTFVGSWKGLVLGDVGGGPSSWLWSGRAHPGSIPGRPVWSLEAGPHSPDQLALVCHPSSASSVPTLPFIAELESVRR